MPNLILVALSFYSFYIVHVFMSVQVVILKAYPVVNAAVMSLYTCIPKNLNKPQWIPVSRTCELLKYLTTPFLIQYFNLQLGN